LWFRKYYSCSILERSILSHSYPSLDTNGKSECDYSICCLFSYRVSLWLEDSGRFCFRVWICLSEFYSIRQRLWMWFRKRYSSWHSYGGCFRNSHHSLNTNGKSDCHYWIEQLFSYRVSLWLEDSGRFCFRVWIDLSEFYCFCERLWMWFRKRYSCSILKRSIL
jgi:hypothetical protein